MVLELLIVCITLVILFNGYMKELIRKMELENDRREIENDELQHSERD